MSIQNALPLESKDQLKKTLPRITAFPKWNKPFLVFDVIIHTLVSAVQKTVTQGKARLLLEHNGLKLKSSFLNDHF